MTTTAASTAHGVSTDHFHSLAEFDFSRARVWCASARRDLVYCGAIFLWSIVAFTIMVTGVSVAASLVALVIGVIVWIGFVYAVRWTTRVDRSLAGWQRRERIDPAYRRPAARGFLPLLKTVTSDAQTWRDLGWLALTSIAGFTLGLAAITAAGIVVAYVWMPSWYWAISDPGSHYTVTNLGLFTVDTVGEAFAAAGIGAMLAPLALAVARGCAAVHARLAARVLRPSPGPGSAEIHNQRDGADPRSSAIVADRDLVVKGEVRTMSAHSATAPPLDTVLPATTAEPVDRDADRYEAIQQYSLKKILAVWAAAALPMGALAWIVAPALKDQFSGPEPLIQALLVCLTAGLIWQFVLVVILVRREVGTLAWPRVRDALWLRAPRSPKTRRVGGKVWWWAILFALLFAAWGAVPDVPSPASRDFQTFVGSDAGQDFFSGAWGWYFVTVAMLLFNTVLGEELLFRGLLLPRMQAVFGRRDWVANGVLFTLYHLHMPWLMPLTFVDGIFLDAYPTKRFQSAWMGIIVHSAQTLLFTGLLLALVLK
jgi:membrane protease YdiL (CAAX protease family)